MKPVKKSLSIFLTCLVLIGAVAGVNQLWSCKGDRLPSEVNGTGRSISSAERNAAFAAQETERAQDTEELYESEAERAAELAVTPYENLEQPDELKGRRECLLFKSQFIISYDVVKLCPYYVCWSLTPERAYGKVQRADNFHGDPVMNDRTRVETFDYNGSGYDRGHMCPAGDNKNTTKAMDESFYMTNICPQNHNLNTGLWNDLEMQCRSWAKNYGTIYICCGPIFDNNSPKTIGQRKNLKIAVPDRFFKVVLALGRVPKAIGFIFPNKACSGDMRDYAVSVDNVEKEAKMDFFFLLEDEQENQLEKECSPAAWGI